MGFLLTQPDFLRHDFPRSPSLQCNSRKKSRHRWQVRENEQAEKKEGFDVNEENSAPAVAKREIENHTSYYETKKRLRDRP